MKVTVKSTQVVTDLDGFRVRLWTGTTEGGIRITLAVRSIIVHRDEDCGQFERELETQLPPLERHADVEDLVARVLREEDNA